jgi:hypothetical protein
MRLREIVLISNTSMYLSTTLAAHAHRAKGKISNTVSGDTKTSTFQQTTTKLNDEKRIKMMFPFT